MIFNEIIKKIRFDLQCDRIGPDIPFTHWKLYFKSSMIKLCKSKFSFFDESSEIRPGAYIVGCSKIVIGRNVIIRPGCRLFGESLNLNNSIIIEDNVMLGSSVSIYVNNHKFDNTESPIILQGFEDGEQVKLLEGCWIGANVIILPGVTIGKNSVIGAGSVVTKSISDYTLAVGNPAREIKHLKIK
jgi:acetyltransferase-like isoleucine patch superfamily enzyme